MTTQRTPKPATGPARPDERIVLAGLVLAVVAALAWTAGMVYAVMGW
ncbi:morphogenic membrane protein MmpA [Streptomyces sp. MMBL 11-3]